MKSSWARSGRPSSRGSTRTDEGWRLAVERAQREWFRITGVTLTAQASGLSDTAAAAILSLAVVFWPLMSRQEDEEA